MGLRRSRTWPVHYVSFMLTWTLSCLLLLALMTLVRGSDGVVFLYMVNPMIVFMAMVLFASAYVLLAMLISLFFEKSSLALAFGLLLWSAALAVPFLTWHWSHRTVSAYLRLPRWVKLATSLIPKRFINPAKFPVSDRRFEWPMIYKYALLMDNVMPFEIMVAMGFMSVLFGLLIWYLEMVFPWTATIPEPLYFPFMATYWNVVEEEIKLPASHESVTEDAQENFEEEPRHLLLVVEALDLCKVYSKKYAVDHLTLRLYYGQIMVLLGHNGAGKTTLVNMLTGMVRPTSGTAIIEGLDLIRNHEDSLMQVRLCPQKNRLYDQMTVYEHLFFFAVIQKIARDVITDQIDAVVKALRLGDHLTNYPKALPGALKRKLCLALAIIADPKILILDEPTAGLDPQSRHEVWELLQKARRSCTILLTTHDMEEADVLGDRIAILAEGSIRCCGSPTFLKRKFGTGYHLKIGKCPKRCEVHGIVSLVKSYVPTVQVVTDGSSTLRLAMGVTSSEGFRFEVRLSFLKVLEKFRVKLGIVSMSMSVTTMEDVYWRLFEYRGGYDLADFQPLVLSLASRGTWRRPDTLLALVCPRLQNRERHQAAAAGRVDLDKLRALCEQRASNVSAFKRTKALMRKRLQYTRKQWKVLLAGLLVPALIFSSQGVRDAAAAVKFEMEPVYKYDLMDMFGGGTLSVVSSDESTFSMAHDFYESLLQHKLSQVTTVRDVKDHVLELGNSDLSVYMRCLIGASFSRDTKRRHGSRLVVTAWHNGEAYHTAAIALNLVHTALLRSLSDDGTATITLHVRPQWRLEEAARRVSTNSLVVEAVVERNIAFSVAMSLMIATFGLFPVADRVSKSKHLQLMTGLTGNVYWAANFLFDFTFYLLAVSFFVGVLYCFYSDYTVTMMGPMVFILVAYGLCVIPMTYLLSFTARSSANCYSTVLIVCFFGSVQAIAYIAYIALLPVVLTRDLGGWAYVLSLRPLMALHPSSGFVLAFMRTVYAKQRAFICSKQTLKEYHRLCVGGSDHHHAEDSPRTKESSDEFIDNCCDAFSRSGKTAIPEAQLRYTSLVEPFVMIGEAVLFVVLLMYRDSGSYGRFWAFLGTKVQRRRGWQHSVRDDDLAREEAHVRSLIASHELPNEVLAVLEMSKRFRRRMAVNSASFSVRQGEIFGILGVNGSGKTTLFRMLTGDLTVDKGRALLKTPRGLSSLTSDIKLWQSSTGYCPQHDGFLEQLSGWDMLALFARLRGVPERLMPEVVRKFSQLVDLEPIVNDTIDTYSGGCRRKLSIGLAIIGMPPVVFLDEPTTGVDAVSRKKLWTSLKSLQSTASMAIVMSSHSMEEVDFLCDRVAIMIDGEFQCLGTIASLKAKYARGYTMAVKTHVEYKDDLDYTNKLLRTVTATFPNIKLRESYEGYLEYHMADTGLPWSQMFQMTETIRRRLNLLEILLCNTTLDQTYVALAKKEGARRRHVEELEED
ncbi:unnamed protein product, partial [Ixodes hexagonus]